MFFQIIIEYPKNWKNLIFILFNPPTFFYFLWLTYCWLSCFYFNFLFFNKIKYFFIFFFLIDLFNIFFTVDRNIMMVNLMNIQGLFMAAIYMTFVENLWVNFFNQWCYTNKMCPHCVSFVFCLSHICSFIRKTFSFAYLFFANGTFVKLWIMDFFVVLFKLHFRVINFWT